MTESFEFPNAGPYEVDYNQHAHYPSNIYPYPLLNHTKMEQFEIGLPPINEVFNEPVQASPIVFDPVWSGHNVYKEFSPIPIDNAYPSYQFESSGSEKPAEANGFSVWQPITSLAQPLTGEFMSSQLQSAQNFPVYDQNNSSSLGLGLQSPANTLIDQIQPAPEPSPTTTSDYQPIYTHSPSAADFHALQLTAFNLNAHNDFSDFGDFFVNPSQFHPTSESSSAGTPQTNSSPITSTHITVDKKPPFRLTRNGKIAKKVTQNCHANSQCSNCKTFNTTLWRRNSTGEVECNACNLYFRKNGTRRPAKLQKRGIMRRTRNPRQPYANGDISSYMSVSP